MEDVSAAVARVGGSSSRGREMSLKREAVASALEAMSSHHAWGNGLGLCSMTSALKQEYVTNDSIPTCRGFVKDAFGHDGAIVENPNVDTSLRLPCAIRNWGLCSKDSLLNASTRGTVNIYRQLKRNNIGRDKLPIILKLSVLGECVYVIITDTVGRGETILVACLDFDDQAWSLQQVKGARAVEPRCAFSQQLIHELLGRAAAKSKVDPTKIPNIAATLVDPLPFSWAGKLALRPPADGAETLCDVPLDSTIPERKASKAAGIATRMPCGLVAQAFSEQPSKLQLFDLGGSDDEGQMTVRTVERVKEVKVGARADDATDKVDKVAKDADTDPKDQEDADADLDEDFGLDDEQPEPSLDSK